MITTEDQQITKEIRWGSNRVVAGNDCIEAKIRMVLINSQS